MSKITKFSVNTPDYTKSFIDSKILASRIQSYWHNRGFPKVRVWVESEKELTSENKNHYIRSNIVFNVEDAEKGNFV